MPIREVIRECSICPSPDEAVEGCVECQGYYFVLYREEET